RARPAERARRPARGVDNPLVRAVARLPARLRTKLVFAFLGIAALLVVLALLGLGVLGQSNTRAESLPTLQVPAAPYHRPDTHARLKTVISTITASHQPSLGLHAQAEFLAIDLETRATALAESTTTTTDALIAANRSSYRGSRDLFIGVAVGSILLALLLGLV